jgi:hypothetical protein
MSPKDQVQGEGDYKSAEKFDSDEQAFIKSGGVERAAGKAEPKSTAEAREMARAEKIGRSHSKGEDEAFNQKSADPKSAYQKSQSDD